MRKTLIAGNWKMHFTGEEAARYVDGLIQFLPSPLNAEVLLIPPFTALRPVQEKIRNTQVLLGGQNLHPEPEGAFTGEISAEMLKSCGCRFVLVGHSERRHLFAETDEVVNQKLRGALSQGLDVIFCIGETGEEREQGKTETVLKNQLKEGLAGIEEGQFSSLTLAYEPVWAIGTGVTASSSQAEEAHGLIRRWIRGQFGETVADQVRILYGGSVNSNNAGVLLAEPDIDGLLVGSASLDPENFCAIISTAQ